VCKDTTFEAYRDERKHFFNSYDKKAAVNLQSATTRDRRHKVDFSECQTTKFITERGLGELAN
jgi:hypothetical protein